MKPGIKTVKYIIVIGFCIFCAIGNVIEHSKEIPDAQNNIVFFELNDSSYDNKTQDSAVNNTFTNEAESNAAEATIKLLNINTADAEELKSLPGIGEVKAQAIISYREAFGSFVAKEELMEVKGIGQTIYDNIKDLITIGDYQ